MGGGGGPKVANHETAVEGFSHLVLLKWQTIVKREGRVRNKREAGSKKVRVSVNVKRQAGRLT